MRKPRKPRKRRPTPAGKPLTPRGKAADAIARQIIIRHQHGPALCWEGWPVAEEVDLLPLYELYQGVIYLTARKIAARNGLLRDHDLIETLASAGWDGILAAADDFEPDAPTKFSTYLGYKLRSEMQRTLARCSLIRVPDYCHPTSYRVRDDRPDLRPKYKEDVDRALRCRPHGRATSNTSNRYDQDDFHSVQRIPAPPIADDIDRDEELASLRAALDVLTPREAHVLRAMFGIGRDPLNNAQIGAELGVGRERVRQIAEAALAKLREHFASHAPTARQAG